MRDTVERLLINEISDADKPGAFEKLGSNLGALGFLIDMLNYQRAMARKLFVYDEEAGELRILTAKGAFACLRRPGKSSSQAGRASSTTVA